MSIPTGFELSVAVNLYEKDIDMHIFMNGRVIVKTGDITIEHIDAIVNAANSSLLGGGGVDGAIHRAGGLAIIEECRTIRKETYPGGLPTGMAVVTTAGNLPAQWVIHTVGPVWRGGSNDEERLLGECYSNCLRVAREKGCNDVAFPAISTGVYGFPKKRAARIASAAVQSYLDANDSPERVVFVFFSTEDAELFLDDHCFSA